MTSNRTLLHYEQRLRRVTDYIHAHLDDEIDLNMLADIAHMSPYHWHRVYHGFTGETVANTVKRLRLQRAAHELAHTDADINDIARHCGYPNRQSFTRIFKAAYGLPPASYRKDGPHTGYLLDSNKQENAMYNVTIQRMDAFGAVGIAHQGDYLNISQSFEHLFTWLGVRNYSDRVTRLVGIYYDDINSIPTEQLRSLACAVPNAATPAIKIEEPVEAVNIAGGEYAILTHKGPYTDLKVAYDWLFGQWLVNSGREAANEPVFEEYLNDATETAPADLLTNICLPLA